jgi:glycosyltransferase involved in cell wall biosynthesis
MKVLIAFPFSIYPVKSGGALRGYHLLRELARFNSVEAILIDSAKEVHESITHDFGHEPHALRITTAVPGNGRRNMWCKLVDRLSTFRLSGSLRTKSNATVLAVSRTLQSNIDMSSLDIAILSTQELAICGTLIKKRVPDAIRIIDMHNLDHLLMKQDLESRGLPILENNTFKALKDRESGLFGYSDAVFACSESDLRLILHINGGKFTHSSVVPNGVNCSAIKFDQTHSESRSNQIIFCGSLSYGPNVDGLKWFHSKVWPFVKSHIPNARLLVVGRGLDTHHFSDLVSDGSVDLIGEVEDLAQWYNKAGVSICPLRMGSGTRLKILEAMAFGNPVVSTSIGCEGLTVLDGEHILIRDTAEAFADGIIKLATSQLDFDRVRSAARKQVERIYDWDVIGAEIFNTLIDWSDTKGEQLSMEPEPDE